MNQNSLRRIGEAIKCKWVALPTISRLYVGSLLLIPMGWLISLLPKSGTIAGTLCVLGICGMSVAVLWDCYRWFVPKKGAFLFKLVLTILAIMAAALATATGKSVVGAATGQDPQYFSLSVAFLAPIAFIPVLALLLLLLGTLGILWVMVLGLIETSSPKADLDIAPPIMIARLLGVLGIMIGAAYLLEGDGLFHRSLRSLAAHSAILMDMHPDRSCSPRAGDQVLRINDDIVILGRKTDATPRFIRIACPLTTQLPANVVPAPPH